MDETLRTALLEMERNDRIRAILEIQGWPGRSLVGEDGCRAAGFVVQHAILDLDLQRRGVELLTEAVEKHEAEPFMLALLTDRVLMQEGKPQIYGTQYIGDVEGGSQTLAHCQSRNHRRTPPRCWIIDASRKYSTTQLTTSSGSEQNSKTGRAEALIISHSR